MKKSKKDLNILLLQIREDEVTLQEELEEFARFSHLQITQFNCLNVFNHRFFESDIIANYDALFIGGSSDATVTDHILYDFIPSCQALIQYCYQENIPVLASCFGFQLAVETFGGLVKSDIDNMEMGLYTIQLSAAAKQDPLLYDVPQEFLSVSGHKERAFTLPDNAVNLAGSKLCPFHLFTFPNKPFYAFQFHPEVDSHDLIQRLTRYKNRYLQNTDSLDALIEKSKKETTESNLLIKKFVERIILES
jgi:GMP synthase (glutamine-hydrolysing)